MTEINPVYRYQKLWLAIGYGLIAMVIYISLVTRYPEAILPIQNKVKHMVLEHAGRRSSLWVYFDKWMHLLTYFVLMGWFAQIYHVKRQRIIYALSFVAMSIMLEVIQSFEIYRKLELLDIVANCLGVLLALWLTKISVFRNLLVKLESYI